MATRTEVVIIDDITEQEGAKTVTFALDGRMYQIDLTEANFVELHRALRPFMEKARRVPRRSTKKIGEPSAASKKPAASSAADIRAWAVKNGHEINTVGRLPNGVRQAFAQAQQERPLRAVG